jgi:hypothetical protein
MDELFTFWYPVIIDQQTDFEGHIHSKEILGVGHIVHSGRLLCRESKERLKNQIKAKKEKVLSKRVEKKPVCPVCLDKYKKNGDSALIAWTEGKPKSVVAKLPPLVKT